jgi:hypothetical protein
MASPLVHWLTNFLCNLKSIKLPPTFSLGPSSVAGRGFACISKWCERSKNGKSAPSLIPVPYSHRVPTLTPPFLYAREGR